MKISTAERESLLHVYPVVAATDPPPPPSPPCPLVLCIHTATILRNTVILQRMRLTLNVLGPVSWSLKTVKRRQFSQSNRHSTIGTRQTEYIEAFPSSANDEVRCDCTFADDGNASWYSVCRVPMVEWRLDCENCRHLTVVGRRPLVSLVNISNSKTLSCKDWTENGQFLVWTSNGFSYCHVGWKAKLSHSSSTAGYAHHSLQSHMACVAWCGIEHQELRCWSGVREALDSAPGRVIPTP